MEIEPDVFTKSVTWEMKSNLGTDKRGFIDMTSFFDSDLANFINADIGTCLYELQSESNIGNNGEDSLFQGNNDFEISIKI